jgi:hypothetical protein
MVKKGLTSVPPREHPAVKSRKVRLFTRTPSNRQREWAKGLLERRAKLPPQMVDELEKFAAGKPYATAIEVVTEYRSEPRRKQRGHND